MYGARAARVRRFSLLLLEEEEDYVQDWVVTAAWPVDRVTGNWQRAPLVGGRVRLCTRSLFFEPDDVRVPIVRIPLSAIKTMTSGPPVGAVALALAAQGAHLATLAAASSSSTPGARVGLPALASAAGGGSFPQAHSQPQPPPASSSSATSSGPSLLLEAREVVLMRANMEEVPYTFLRSGSKDSDLPGYRWAFGPCYSPLQPLLAQAAALLEINRRPREQRNAALEELSSQRMDSVSFDLSRLLDFGERVVWSGPVVALTPLVREQGHLAITPVRVYFQPLHNIAGDAPVKSHPLAAIAAVARRRSSLRPVGLELFFLHPAAAATAAAAAAAAGGAGGGGGRSQQPPPLPRVQQPLHGCVATGPLWDAPSAFFAFRSETDREAARHLLTIQHELGRCVPRQASFPSLSNYAQQLQPQSQPLAATGTATSAATGDNVVDVAVWDTLTAHGHLLEASGPWLRRVTAAWQRGALSNFDYLLYLNFAAGRSFNDLAQWPVFPWVLRNYVSSSLDLNDPNNFRDLTKPIGALNTARLEEFRQRFRDMPHDSFEGSVPPFLYGTHYSTPGYVMYWLVRAAPSHMLRLQNGRFDSPDRLFASVQEAWEGVLHSTTDVKELIPEFFMPGWDFLVNHRRLPLGLRQSGRPVDDVELPPWATDPRDFLTKNRAALESPVVSQQLHNWIDLIFGYKQLGPAAEDADNVFYYLTYEGAVDVSSVSSAMELKALETQINEFGQTPKQLFTTPHPPRLVCPEAPDPTTIFPEDRSDFAAAGGGGTGYGGEGDAGNRDLALALLSTIMAAAAPEYSSASASASPTKGAPDGGDGGAVASTSASAATQTAKAAASTQPQPARPAAAASAASLISGFLKLGRYQQQQQQQQHQTGSASILGPITTSTITGAAQTVGSGAVTGLAAMASAPSAVAGAASALFSSLTGAFHHAAGGGGGGGGNSSAAATGRSDGPVGRRGGGGAEQPVNPSALGTSLHSGVAATKGVPTDMAEAAHAGGAARPRGGGSGSGSGANSEARGSCGGGALGGAAVDWGWGSHCTTPFRAVGWSQLTRGSLAAVASGRNGYLYCAGQSGIRVVAENTDGSSTASAAAPMPDVGSGGGSGSCLTVVRSAQLDGELLSLSLLPVPTSAAQRHQRLMLLGSHNRKVYAYSPDVGRVVGAFDAHDDAVCCVQLMATGDSGAFAGGGSSGGGTSSSTALVTASWDCSVKIWSLAEGRAPWTTGLSLPTAELRDFESGVWVLATDPWGGPLLATGTEEGVVALWDTRAPGRSSRPGCSCVWQNQVAEDYVGGLALITSPTATAAAAAPAVMVLAATADGALTLYDVRTGGSSGGGSAGSNAQRLAATACGAPIRCCAADSRAAVAGEESGAVRVWDVGLMAGGMEAVRPGGPEPDGLYPAWDGNEAGGAALCGLDVYRYPYGRGDTVRLAAVTEGGRLVVLESGAGAGGSSDAGIGDL